MSSIKEVGPTVVLLLLIGVSVLASNPIFSITRVLAATQNISLAGNASTGWIGSTANPTITVIQGDTVALTTSSADNAPHRFFIDVDGNGQSPNCSPDKCAMQVPPTSTYTFSVDFSPGTYTYYCSFHPITMTGSFVVQGFSIIANPSSMTLSQGKSQLSAIAVSSQNGFSGTVNLSPSAPSGISVTLSTSSVSITPTSSGTSNLNVTIGSSTTPGPYTVSVTGTSGSQSHTANAAVTVVGPDFMISSDQPSLSIVLGSPGNATITLTSQGGFAGNVNLAVSVSPSGPTASLSPSTLSIASGASAVSKLTVTTSSGLYSSTSPGTYTVTVTATGSPSLSHSTTLSITVTSPSSPAASIPAYVLVIAGVAILAVVVIVAYAILRRKPGKPAVKSKP